MSILSLKKAVQTLSTFPTLSHAQRQRFISTTCHQWFTHGEMQPHIDSLLETLRQGDFTQRMLAPIGAFAAQHTASLMHSVHDPSLQVQSLSLFLLCKLPNTEDLIVDLMATTTPYLRQKIISHTQRFKRTTLATRLVKQLLQHHHRQDAQRLLPFCHDEALLKTTLLETDNAFSINWKTLGKFRPELMLHEMERRVEQAPDHSTLVKLGFLFLSALEHVATTHPQRVANLLLQVQTPLSSHNARSTLRKLSNAHPKATLEVLLCPKIFARSYSQYPALLGTTPRHWPTPLQRQLLNALAHNESTLTKALQQFAPSKRGPLFLAAITPEARQQKLWSTQLLRTLHHSIRHAETTRILTTQEVQDAFDLRLRYQALLPPHEVHDTLLQETRNSQVHRRSRAWTSLIESSALSREPMTNVLQEMLRLKNEQDPVKQAAFEQLSNTPASRFTKADAPHLLDITQHAVEARDTSWQTRRALHQTFSNLLEHFASNAQHPLTKCALEGLLKLAHQAGIIDIPSLWHRLPKGAEQALCKALLPWLKASTKRHYFANVLRLATSLGKRAYNVKALQDLLETIIWEDKHNNQRAAELWLKDPQARGKRALALLKKDPSAFYIREVAGYLHLKRQDLLKPYLTGKVIRGKFAPSSKVYTLPHFYQGFWRWHSELQHTFMKTLLKLIQDKKQNVWTRASGIRTLVQIPETKLAHLTPLLESKEVAIQEAALGQAVWLDHMEVAVLDLLTQHLDGDRARVAMYAMPRAARLFPQTDVLRTLGALLERSWLKITVHKEVLRLLGSMRQEEAALLLAEQATNPELHRDVQIAALHAAYQSIDLEPTWQTILNIPKVATHAVVLKNALFMSCKSLSSSQRTTLARAFMPLGTHHDHEVRNALFFTLKYHLPHLTTDSPSLAHEALELAGAEILNTTSKGAWHNATQLIQVASDLEGTHDWIVSWIGQTIETLKQAPLKGDATDDLPLHQRVDYLVSHISRRANFLANVQCKERLVEEVQWPDELWSLRLQLVIQKINWSSPWEDHQLEAVLQSLPDLTLLSSFSWELDDWFDTHQRWETLEWDKSPDHLKFLTTLLEHDAIEVQSFGLLALIHAGSQKEWPPSLQTLLIAARKHAHPWVRTLARRTYMDT